MIPALVLTAGHGTRLSPLSLVRAKAALPVGGMPIAARILLHLAKAGVTDAVLNLHHLPASITSRIGDGSDLGVSVRYSWESPEVLGAAGGPRQALDLLAAPTFLVVNGDTLTNLDVGAIVSAHARSGALVTIAVVPNHRPEHYSGVKADAQGRFVGIVPRGADEPSFHVIGVQVVDARAYASLDQGVPVASVWPLYQGLTQTRPDAVQIYECSSSFLDVGTPDDYFVTCRSLSPSAQGLIEQGERLSLHRTAQVQHAIAWDDVVIEADVQLHRAIVTDGVRVPAGTVWNDVILRKPGSVLGRGERLVGELGVTSLNPA